jgi:nitrite reductase/ring-hydroxylating ferredoxin subunit
VRRGEQVWAYANRCPHFSVPLDAVTIAVDENAWVVLNV